MTPTKTDNEFLGWYTNSELTGTAVTQIPKNSTGNKSFYAKWQPPTTLPDFEYTGQFKLVVDDSNDTLIASGTNKRVVLPADYQNYQGNWKLKLLTSGDLTIYNIPKSSSIDIFLVGGGAKGGTGDWIYPWNGGTCYRGGKGGAGGACSTKSNISYPTGVKIDVEIGGSNQESSITINGTKYSAAGGGGAAGGSARDKCDSDSGRKGTAGCKEFGTGTTIYGGGGGSAGTVWSYPHWTNTGGSGGNGGGGKGGTSGWAGKPNGCTSSPATAGEAGKPNTGGGGGGGGAGCKKEELSGGSGGTGIVILRNKR